MDEGKEGSQDKDKGKKPPTTPEPPPPKTVPDVKEPPSKPTDEDVITISKSEFASLQKQVLDLQNDAVKADKVKDDAERTYTYNALKALNPKLAKINKDASLSTLKTVIETAKEIKNDFPSLDSKDKPPPKAGAEDHDSMDYDFVKKEWVYT